MQTDAPAPRHIRPAEMPRDTPETIVQVALGFMAAKHLFVANEIGLFEALARGSLTLDALAERMVTPPRTTRMVADAMIALGLLEHRAELYQNSSAAQTFLAGRMESGLRPFLRFMDRISYPAWNDLEDAVRSDRERGRWGSFDDEAQQIYSAGVEALTTGAAHALARAYDFGAHRHLLDLGGGTGSFLLAILGAHPHLGGTLFELPPVAASARRRLADQPEAARVDVVAGDFLEDALPTDHDVVLLANVMHCFSPARNRDLLQRIRHHTADRGRLLLVDLWTDPTRTQPPAAALLAGEFLVICGEGDVYSETQVSGWLRETGWRTVDRRPLAGPMSLIVAAPAAGNA